MAMKRKFQCCSEESTEALEQERAAADEYCFSVAGRPESVLTGLKELYEDSTLCDVILRVGEKTFPAHKCVLAAFSPYFKAMFTSQLRESQDHEVTLKDIEPTIVETLLKFGYTDAVCITQENVQSLMAASNLLQVLAVRDACSMFMEEHIDASNCLGVGCFAETINCERLQEVANAFALSNFTDVVGHEDFLNLPPSKLLELVSSDALNVMREEDVFTAVLNWLNHQSDDRKEGFQMVMESVRLPMMSPYSLQDFVTKHEFLLTWPDCHKLVDEARLYHLLPDRRSDMQGIRFQPRMNTELVDVIVCAGGNNITNDLDCVEAFDPASNKWISLEKLPSAVSEHGCVVTGKNVLYVAGGNISGNITNQLLAFFPKLNKWVEMASMSVARRSHGMAVLDGFVYVVGGWDRSQLNSVERYNTETNTWEELPGLQTGIFHAAVVAHDGYLYMAGGFTAGDSTSDVQRFDPRTRTWSELAPLSTHRFCSAACVQDGKLYITGGVKGHGTIINTVECYDIHKNQWSSCSPMRAQRSGHGAAVVNGHIYVFGGESGRYESVERYTPSADRWEDVTDMPTPRYDLTSATLQVPRALLVSGNR